MFELSQENLKLKKNLEGYLYLYGKYYPKITVEFIRENFLRDKYVFDMADILNQVYFATGTYDLYPDINPYLKVLREMQKSFDIDRDLLEVGSGYYPAMASIIDQYQENGSITGIDYNAATPDIGKIKIIKDTFTVDTDISKYQMLYGVCPCEATIPMIKSANKSDIDLFIVLSDGTHLERHQPMMYPMPVYLRQEKWYKYVEEVLSSTLPPNRKYDIYRVNDIDFPIIKTYKRNYY